MRQFIYRLEVTRPDMLTDGPTPEEERTLADHFSFLKAQAEDGIVQLAGRTDTTGPETYGIVIFEAENDEGARLLMAADPAVASGVMTGEVQPFRVAIGGDRLGG